MPVRRKDFLGTQGRRDTQVKSLGGVPRESYCIIVFTYNCLPSPRRPSVGRVGGDAAVKSFGSAYFFPFSFSFLPFSVLTLERRGLSRMMCPLPPQ